MQLITIKYIPPTNKRGAKLKAITASGLSYTEPRDYALDFGQQAINMVAKLQAKHGLKWGKPLSYGTDNKGHLVVTFDNFLLRNI